jgi:lysophospholipase L1-like esterase
MRKSTALLAATVGVCVVAGEVVLRARGFGRPLAHEYDEALFWKMSPGQLAFTPFYRVSYRTNSRGLRDGEISAKAPGAYRVLLLGDSVVFGHGVPVEDTLAERLERGLRNLPGLGSAEVINAGVTGYSVDQYLSFLRREGFGLEPDLVLIGFCKNDIISPEDLEELRSLAREGRLYRMRTIRGRLRRLSAWCHVADGLVERVASLWTTTPRALAYAGAPVTREAWDHTLAVLEEIARETEARGTALLVACFPYRDEVDQRRARVDPAPLEAVAARHGFRMVDLLEAYTAARGEGLFFDPVHPTGRGHAVAADAVLAELRSGGLLRTRVVGASDPGPAPAPAASAPGP